MAHDDPKALVERWYEAVNAKDRAWLEAHYDPAFVGHGGAAEYRLDVVRKWWDTWWPAFPDLRFTLTIVAVAGDIVVHQQCRSGTQQGPFRGQAPSGRRIDAWGLVAQRVRNGKLVEEWGCFDLYTLYAQLDMVPKVG